MKVMEDISKFVKLKLEKSMAWSTLEQSADKGFGKMIAAVIKQLPDNVKPLAKHEVNGVIFK